MKYLNGEDENIGQRFKSGASKICGRQTMSLQIF